MEWRLFLAAAAFYTAATVLAFVFLRSRDERWSEWMLRLMGLGVSLHLLSFGLRLSAFWSLAPNRYFAPVDSFFGALSYLALAFSAAFFFIEARHRLGILGAFVLPWSCVACWAALWAAGRGGTVETGLLVPELRSYWMNLHPLALMTAYAVLGNAFGVGLAWLVQDRQMKSRRPTELCYRLPALELLDRLNERLISVACPVLALGIAMGGAWAHGAWGRFWGWDAKETWALVTLLVYVACVLMRRTASWRGRRAVYASMLGFACALFTFAGVNFLSGLHGYLSQGAAPP